MSTKFHFDQRTARRAHKCVICAGWIDKGHEYVHLSGDEDGYYYSLHLHIHCDALRRAYLKVYPERKNEICAQDTLNFTANYATNLFHPELDEAALRMILPASEIDAALRSAREAAGSGGKRHG